MNPTVATIEPEDYRQIVRLKLVLLAFLGVIVFLNGLLGVFALDDAAILNPGAQTEGQPSPWLSSQRLVTGTLALNHALGGQHPLGYHIVNILLHVLAALALFGVVCRTLLRQPSQKLQEAAPWLAFAIALLWTVHPLQTQSVTYISGRADALAGLFYFLTLYGVVRSTEEEHGRLWAVLAIVACALGMGIRPVMITAPLVALLFDRIYLSGSFAELWRRRAGLYVGLAVSWVLLALPGPAPGSGATAPSLTAYILTQPGVILHYLRLTFWPVGLSLDYFDYPVAQGPGDYLPGLVVVGVLLAATVLALRRWPKIGFLGLFFFLTLAPSSLVPSPDLVSEARMYLPLTAVSALVVLGGFGLVLAAERHSWALATGLGLTAVVVAVLGFVTFQRNYDYASPVALWQQTVAVRPGNLRARWHLGRVAYLTGKWDEAAAAYRMVLEGPSEPALHSFQMWALTDPANNVGLALLRANQPDEALRTVSHFSTADLDGAVTLEQLGFLSWAVTDSAEAVQFFREAVRLQPDVAKYHFNLALALKAEGKKEAAATALKEGLRLDPEYPRTAREQAWQKATSPNAGQRNPLQAIFLAELACQASPEQRPELLDTLAAAYASGSKFDDAVATAEKAHALAGKDNSALAGAIQERLALYKLKKPFVQEKASP